MAHMIFGNENARDDEMLYDCHVAPPGGITDKPILRGRWGVGKTGHMLYRNHLLTKALRKVDVTSGLLWYRDEGGLDTDAILHLKEYCGQNSGLYGIYRAFIHTPVNQITVTAVPREINVKTRKTRYVSGYKRTIGKTRAEALALAKKYLRISSFSDLVTETKVADMVFPNHWSKDFDRLYYNEQGYPGIRHFVGELAK